MLMSGRGSARRAACLQCAAALWVVAQSAALAQAPAPPPPADPAELDPSAPLDPLPDLEVGWPDLNANDSSPAAAAAAAEPAADVGEHNYALAIEGLRDVGAADELLKAFRQQSALEADRKDPANAAQITRRARADADLLEQLLRSQGYYDADVEPRTEAAGNMVRVVLEAIPGEQYRFASVELPGLDAAGLEA